MEPYRIYFLGSPRLILGRDDFDASDDRQAMLIAELLCDAASDISTSFELWQGTRRVDIAFQQRVSNTHRITAQVEEVVAGREQAIQEGSWTIAKSKRLLQQTQQLLDRGRRQTPRAEERGEKSAC